jgi:hypothetical protein
MGIPMPWGLTQTRRVAIVHPEGSNDGSVEIIGLPGVQGRDCSAACRPPNIGIAATRFEVADARAYREAVLSRGGAASELANVELAPFGRTQIFSVRTPDGAQLEFFTPAASAG